MTQKVCYCLAVKSSQPTLHQGIEDYLQEQIEADFEGVKHETFSSEEKRHLIADSRRGYVCPVPEDFPDAKR